MAERPLLTVAVALYQAEETIAATLNSVFSQGFSDLEVVVVDDCSTDGSVKAVKAVDAGSTTVRIIEHQKNQGLGPSRNTAIAHAHGKYIVFLDADDELLPGSLSAIAKVASQGDSDMILIGCIEKRRGKDRPMDRGMMLPEISSSADPWTIDTHPELFFWPTSTWSKVLRTDYLRRIGIEFPTGYHQDIPSTVDMLLGRPRVRGVDFPCYLYIRRGEGTSATRSKGTKTLVRLEQVKRVRERHDPSQLEPLIARHLVTLMTIHLIWGNRAAYRTIPDALHEEYFQHCAAELAMWWGYAKPGPDINSEPLMPTAEREFFSEHLVAGSWPGWQRALRIHARRLAWQRRLDPSRYRLFRRSE